MKVEVIGAVRYYPDGFTLCRHGLGEVVDIEDRFAHSFISQGLVTPISDRETKPLGGTIEIKGHSRTGKRARNADRAKAQS